MIFFLNFLKTSLATHQVARSFSCVGVSKRVKKVLAFPKMFRFDPGSSMKLLSSKIKKNVSPKHAAILSWQSMPTSCSCVQVAQAHVCYLASPFLSGRQQFLLLNALVG